MAPLMALWKDHCDRQSPKYIDRERETDRHSHSKDRDRFREGKRKTECELLNQDKLINAM